MDSSAAPVVDPLTVGKAFVMQYYEIMYIMPEHLHRFYKDVSKVGRVGQDGVMRHYSTLQGITEVLKTLSYGDCISAEITSYDSQESHNGGFLVVVTGYFTLNERVRKKFIQTFFLAPQENGFFVLNDILKFVKEPEATDCEANSGKDSEKPSPVNAPTGNQGSEQAACVSVNHSKVPMPLNYENASVAKENVRLQVPDIEISCKEVADVKNSYPDDDGLEDVPKKSYASVLKVRKDNSGVPALSLPSPKQIPVDQDHQVSSDPCLKQIGKIQDHQFSSDPSPVVESDAVSEVVDGTENEQNQGLEDKSSSVSEGTSVYVKHLPANATIDMLETEFKQFGAISDRGIQVISHWGFGYSFGFVEFKEADAAHKAIEASPVMIGGQKAFVEEKRSTSKGNRGSGYGNRNAGVRGRPSYGYRRGGGRSFNRRGTEYFVKSLNTY